MPTYGVSSCGGLPERGLDFARVFRGSAPCSCQAAKKSSKNSIVSLLREPFGLPFGELIALSSHGNRVGECLPSSAKQTMQRKKNKPTKIEVTTPTRAESQLALRAIAMPVFANAHGDIFGGWLLSQMDLAGSAVAVRRANGRVVTVAVTAMSFQRPVFVGDEVSCYAKILKVGRTSITMKVEAFARRGRSGEQIQVTEGVFTYVAVYSESKPRPV